MTAAAVTAPRRTGSRLRGVAFGVGSQLLNAGTNVLTTYVASLLLSPSSFGAFVLAFAVVTIVLGSVRGLMGNTLMVQLPAHGEADGLPLVRSALGLVLLVGAGSVVVLAVGGFAAPVLWWFAPWVTVALAHDVARYVFLATGRNERAFAIDAVWAVVQVAIVGVGAAVGSTVTLGLLVTAWGVGALAGVVAFAVLHPARPESPRRWVAATSDVSGWFVGVAVLAQIEVYGVLLLTGAVLGPADVGGVRAVQLLAYQPAVVLLGALIALLAPVVVRARAAGQDLAARSRSLHLVVAPIVAGLIVVMLFRDSLLGLLFPQYVAFAPLVVPVALQSVFAALSLVPMAVQQGLRQGAASFAVQATRAGAILVASAAGAWLGGPTGLAWALALVAGVAWVQVTVAARRAIARDRRDRTAPNDQHTRACAPTGRPS